MRCGREPHAGVGTGKLVQDQLLSKTSNVPALGVDGLGVGEGVQRKTIRQCTNTWVVSDGCKHREENQTRHYTGAGVSKLQFLAKSDLLCLLL